MPSKPVEHANAVYVAVLRRPLPSIRRPIALDAHEVFAGGVWIAHGDVDTETGTPHVTIYHVALPF